MPARRPLLRRRILQLESLEGRAMLATSLLTLSATRNLISDSASHAADVTTNMTGSHAAADATLVYGTTSEASAGSSIQMVSLAQPEGEGAMLDTHPVRLDAQNKLLPWFTPEDKAYGHVSKLSADFIKAAVQGPVEHPSGLPVIFLNSEYHPTTFLHGGSPNNPAGKNAMLADSMALYYAYSGDQGVIDAVKALLDYQLTPNGTTPANYAWPNVPWSDGGVNTPVYGGGGADGVGMLEPDKVGELGFHGYLRFYQITGETRYRDAAIACANALAANIRPGNATQSPWPFRVNAQTGALPPIPEEYSSHVIAPIRLFDELIRLNLGNVAAYQSARTTAWNWLMTHPMQTNTWAKYFEDVPPESNVNNLNQYVPGQTARYFLERPDLNPNWQADATGLLNWIVARFGGDDRGEAGLQYGARVIAEQNAYSYKMASHTSRYGAVLALLASKTGNAVLKDQAFRSLNWASYMARTNGSVIEGPAEFAYSPNNWFTDGHGDYIRHFMLGMSAFPEWAPAGENHILGSTSVVKSVSYPASGTAVYYSTFDADSKETLRINFIPESITVDGVTLEPRANLTQPGWTFDSVTGVLRIWHTNGTNIQIIGAPDTLPPTQPTNLSSPLKTFDSISLTWTASTDNILVAGYDVYRDGIKVGNTSTLNYTDTGLTPSTAYSYTIQALDIAGNVSIPSVALVVTTDPPDTQPPTKPAGLNITNKTATRLTLNWSAATDNYGVTRYDIFRNGVQVSSSTFSSYNDTGLTALTTYSYTIRAFDAAGNGSPVSDPLVVITNARDPLSFWNDATPTSGAADPETSSVELGVKFRTDVAGTVTAIKFYKAANNTGTHTGKLWSSTGTLLASGTFTNETASGWQTLILATPIAIQPNTTYIASYHAPAGRYWSSNGFFANSGVVNGELRALQNGVDSGNGVYAYGPSSFPNQTYQSTNYWVDVVFLPQTPATVINRQVFYNRSSSGVFGNGSGNPINAIDPTKSPLLPGQSANPANHTNYALGLNGIVIDVLNLTGTPSASDFQFASWNGIDTAGFVATSATPTIASIPGGGIGGSTRIKIEFDDNAIRNTWLRVTMLTTANTRLSANDVFYFGNAVAEMNVGNTETPLTLRVNATDTSAVRQNQSTVADSVGISNLYDINKDGRVNAIDTSIVRQNQLNPVLRYFEAPVMPPSALLNQENDSPQLSSPRTFAWDTSVSFANALNYQSVPEEERIERQRRDRAFASLTFNSRRTS